MNQASYRGSGAVLLGSWTFLALVLGALLFLAEPGIAQTPELGDAKELVVTHLVTLGDDDGPGILGDIWDVERRKNGDWVVADYYLPQRLRIFSAEGKWKSAFGRKGEGPGEITLPGQLVVLPDDGLAVIDGMAYRVTRFGPDLQPGETARIPGAFTSFSLLSGNRFVLGTQRSTSGLLQLCSGLNLDLETIEPNPEGDLPLGSDRRYRVLPKHAADAFWAGHIVEYTLERWAPSGERLQRIELEPDWFRPHENFGTKPKEDGPPDPNIRAIHEDEEGLVWVLILVADPAWEEAFEDVRDPYGRPRERVQDRKVYYDTVIQVIDPDSETILGSVRLDEPMLRFTTEGLVVGAGTNEFGSPVARVYEVALHR